MQTLTTPTPGGPLLTVTTPDTQSVFAPVPIVSAKSKSNSLEAEHKNKNEQKIERKMEELNYQRKTKSNSTLSRIPLTPKLARLFRK